jgi:Winged helix DNA-binding domain
VTDERTLTTRELNRALLARQLLLERSKMPLTRALERVGGLQTQYAPSAYVSLWSRLEGFEREALTRALERRSAVQGTLMRVTIHVVSAADYPLFAAGIRRGRRDWWLRAHGGRIDAKTVAAAARRVRKLLADGPRRQKELDAALEAERAVMNGAGLWVDLVRVPPSGTWDQRRADLYAAADDWLGPSDATEQEGLEHLARRYFQGFGPATPNELADWAGLPVTMFKPVVEKLKLRRFRSEDGKTLLDLPRAPLPDPETPAPVRFLPVWEATLLVHARRTQILPEQYRARVFNTKTPHSVPTFLVDGQVAGTWRYEKGRVKLSPFHKLPRATRKELDEEAERLAAFHG